MRGRRNSYANVMATIAVFAAIGGAVAIGGVTDKQGRIKACYDKKGKDRGELRLRVKGKCKKSTEKGIKWAKQGPAGPQGEQGPSGPQGKQGPAGPAGSDAQFNGAPAGGDLDGTYPNPSLRKSAWIGVGTVGAPPFEICTMGAWVNTGPGINNAAGFLRDGFGFVHLRGRVRCASGEASSDPIFQLPAGYRPARNEQFPAIEGDNLKFNGITVNFAGVVKPAENTGATNWISLDGISFRCVTSPSGSDGCP